MALNIAHFGYGYWGPNLVRNISANADCQLKWIVDESPSSLQAARERFPGVQTTSDPNDVFADPDVDAVSIATPASTHFRLAKTALEAGKHVFVEKPLCPTVDEAAELVRIAESCSRILFVGHVFVYNSVVREIKRLLDEGELGELYCIHSQRLSLGRVRSDVDVLWNLAPHDISIFLYLLGEMPETVRGYGHSFLQSGINDIGFIDMTFPSGVSAHIHCSWLHPRKTREIIIVGSRKMLVYDDVSTDSKLAIYDCGIDKRKPPRGLKPIDSFAEFQLYKRTGKLTIPNIEFPEPLATQLQAFVDCIQNRDTPITDGKLGLEVVRILERASQP